MDSLVITWSIMWYQLKFSRKYAQSNFFNNLTIFLGIKQWCHMKKIKIIIVTKCFGLKHKYSFVNKLKAIEKTYGFFSSICLSRLIFLTYIPSFSDLSLLTSLSFNFPGFQNSRPWSTGLKSARQYSLAPFFLTRKESETKQGDQVFLLRPTDLVSYYLFTSTNDY